MQQFNILTGVAAPLMRINVDTDAIIPSREMKRVSKQGLGDGLFAGWRYLEAESRTINPEFVLNKPAYNNVSILLSGANFGCGSSREHAVWALQEFGVRAIIAESFGAIFYGNCTRNGILPIVLADDLVQALVRQVEVGPQNQLLEINLPEQKVTAPDGQQYFWLFRNICG